MSKETETTNETEKTKKQEPIGVTISKAQSEVTVAILQIQAAYGLPAYLTDLIVTSALADIRACANKDLIEIMDRQKGV